MTLNWAKEFFKKENNKMKKSIRIISLVLLLALVASVFVGCSNATESYAEKINNAAKENKHYTYQDVIEDLGDEAIDITADLFGSVNGVIIAVQGCKSMDEIEDKIDDGKDVKGVVIIIAGSKATSATYKVITEDDLKKK